MSLIRVPLWSILFCKIFPEAADSTWTATRKRSLKSCMLMPLTSPGSHTEGTPSRSISRGLNCCLLIRQWTARVDSYWRERMRIIWNLGIEASMAPPKLPCTGRSLKGRSLPSQQGTKEDRITKSIRVSEASRAQSLQKYPGMDSFLISLTLGLRIKWAIWEIRTSSNSSEISRAIFNSKSLI